MITKELLLLDKQLNWFLVMPSTPGKDAVKIVEMSTQNLGHYLNLVDNTVVGLQRFDSNWKMSSYGWNVIKQHCMAQGNQS